MSKTKKLTIISTLTAVSLILSYVEMLLPPFFPSVPGIKMGFANIITIFILYCFSVKYAVASAFIRVSLSSLLFGNATVFIYSIAGSFFSITAMALIKKTKLFSHVGTSISGAVMHNLGQVIVAAVLMHTKMIFYYMAVLTISGTISGIVTGIAGGLLINRLKGRIQ